MHSFSHITYLRTRHWKRRHKRRRVQQQLQAEVQESRTVPSVLQEPETIKRVVLPIFTCGTLVAHAAAASGRHPGGEISPASPFFWLLPPKTLDIQESNPFNLEFRLHSYGHFKWAHGTQTVDVGFKP